LTFSCISSLNVNGVYDSRTVDLPNGETVDGALAVDEEVLQQVGIDVAETAVVTFSVDGTFAQRFTLDVLREIIEKNMDVDMGMLGEATTGEETQAEPEALK